MLALQKQILSILALALLVVVGVRCSDDDSGDSGPAVIVPSEDDDSGSSDGTGSGVVVCDLKCVTDMISPIINDAIEVQLENLLGDDVDPALLAKIKEIAKERAVKLIAGLAAEIVAQIEGVLVTIGEDELYKTVTDILNQYIQELVDKVIHQSVKLVKKQK